VNILGISAFYHDSAAALVVDGDVVAAAQRGAVYPQEAAFPRRAVACCLEAVVEHCFVCDLFAGTHLGELDAAGAIDREHVRRRCAIHCDLGSPRLVGLNVVDVLRQFLGSRRVLYGT
jgi:predicted NodU family carbamoyl transferase